MILEIWQIILTYPHSPDVRELMESGMKDFIDHYGVLCEADFKNRTLTISTTPDRPRLERIFPPSAVTKLLINGFKVKRRFCPEGTRFIAVTYTERDWERHKGKYEKGYYSSIGFKVQVVARRRKVIILADKSTFDELSFEMFNSQILEGNIEKVEFLT